MAAALAGISISEILKAGDWSTQSIFERFYYRPHKPSFGQVVLSMASNLQSLDVRSHSPKYNWRMGKPV